MQFIDEAKIHIQSGAGGDGCLSFRREANLPKGGPDGGNGGRGGSVVFEAVSGLNTLIDFRFKQHFKAKRGGHGMGQNRTGAASEDLIIKLPVGTQIFLEDGETLITDITEEGQRYIPAVGGKGGAGNAAFKSSTNRAPRKTGKGEEAQEMWLWLKLKLLSDVGLVGLPNAGKSTLLSSVSRAKPKIADYPFTTLKPQLGVVHVDGKEFVMADIPGLIAGASEGQGLGDRFLKHIERCKILLHMVDATLENPVDDFHTIRNELSSYSDKLPEKKCVIMLNKSDSVAPEKLAEIKKELEKSTKFKVFSASAVTKDGIENVLRELYSVVKS